MPYSIFISYSTKDRTYVEHVQGAVSVFVAEHKVVLGASVSDTIIRAIKSCDMFVLLWSKNSKASVMQGNGQLVPL